MSGSVSTKGQLPEEMRRTKIGVSWVLLVIGVILLAFLLVFVLQNLDTVRIHFLTVDFTMPLGVALLLAAIGGALIASIPFAARIFQLRRATRRDRHWYGAPR
ncbi:lipopolysaccharide assembly protein LapA domain-containing protein [Asanoa sp. WMMD1127]|uniref:LapA family protein n=1 Tax=Asanoa sp. WMMD1127 TaxID=3016107 RepID=UPI0024178FD5|nr:lipopolysaccharide assembly protein LapA domain-containing protein [Asanoa sp. WMMD1127]MDG4821832.1 lipopolysaccharide assembly protein LapA domain-containing protein [Asanoa sp. WMMD1127]